MFWAGFSVCLIVQLFDGCRSRVLVRMRYAGNRAGYVAREGEGSTGPSRGKHRLTVYRAHTSWPPLPQNEISRFFWAVDAYVDTFLNLGVPAGGSEP